MKRTGKYAYVNDIACTQGWSVGRTSSVQRYQASCVPGASGATPGNTDESGSIKGLGYLPPLPTGENFSFVGVASNKPGELVNYFGDVLISDAQLKIPVAAGTPISWSANFGVQGELEQDNSTSYEDPTRVAAPSAKFGKITVEQTLGSNTFTDVDRVQDITLNFRRPASTTVNDGTTERDGGNLEVDLSFMIHNDDLDTQDLAASLDLCDLNQINRVRVYVTSVLFYQFDSFIWQAKSNFNVDRSSNPPPIIGYTCNGLWTALRADQAHLGRILLPDTTEFYPGDTST
jgi:hypothetical protein